MRLGSFCRYLRFSFVCIAVAEQSIVRADDLASGLERVLLHPLTMRIPIIVLPKFTPHTFFTTIQSHQVTWSFVVPPLVSLLANFSGVAKYDMSSLRGLLSGAAPMSPDVAQTAMGKLSDTTGKDFMITQGYGTHPSATI